MKIRFSKTMAAVLAACVGTFSGISALAAVDVYTTTTYDYNNASTASVTVKSVVTDNANAGKMVTYLVSTGSGEEMSIKYIDQATLSAAGTAEFTFTANQGDIFGGTVTAKYGSNAGYADLPTFTFNPGANFLSKGTATIGIADVSEIAGAPEGAQVIIATVSGNYTEYGVKLSKDGETDVYLPAYGAVVNSGNTAATFAVVISDLDAGWTPTAYVR